MMSLKPLVVVLALGTANASNWLRSPARFLSETKIVGFEPKTNVDDHVSPLTRMD